MGCNLSHIVNSLLHGYSRATSREAETQLTAERMSNNLNLENIQGDVLVGLHKRVQAFLFFTLKSQPDHIKTFKQKLRHDILPLITSTKKVLETAELIKQEKQKHPKCVLPIVELNISFSATGLVKLGIPAENLPGKANDAFHSNQRSDAITNLGDPMDPTTKKLTTWSPDYLDSHIDSLIMITAPNDELLKTKVEEIKHMLHGLVDRSFIRRGNVRPDEAAGHEHFGYLDGISQPKIKGFDDQKAEGNNVGVVEPGVILTQSNADPTKDWMKDGSFIVIRELQQFVPEFNQFVNKVAQDLRINPGLIGARIVGRWKSGAPVVLAPSEDNSLLARSDAFDFSDDLLQQKCPYAAHIRKTNPRAGMQGVDRTTAILPHLIMRAGIPYGPELTEAEILQNKTIEERGLMFICYQSSIEDGFQRVQQHWSNDATFPPNNPAKVTPGFDLLIGQTSSSKPRPAQNIIPKGEAGTTDTENVVTAERDFVVPRGGEYLFTPSIDAIKHKLTASD